MQLFVNNNGADDENDGSGELEYYKQATKTSTPAPEFKIAFQHFNGTKCRKEEGRIATRKQTNHERKEHQQRDHVGGEQNFEAHRFIRHFVEDGQDEVSNSQRD